MQMIATMREDRKRVRKSDSVSMAFGKLGRIE
jgi:hypothetical protein